MKKQPYTHSCKGFNLVEISIAITIIALIIVSITTGSNIKRKLELKQIMDEVDTISTALTSFNDSYSSIPGDMWNAESSFGEANVGNRTADGNGDGNGDGDGTLENNLTSPSRDETLLFWQHLQAAGLISGYYSVTSQEPGQGVKSGPLKRSGFYATTAGAPIEVFVTLSRYNIAGDTGGMALITPKEAYDLDMTFDDGSANSGRITSTEGTGETANSCADGANYTLTTTDETCIMTFTVQ